MSGWLPGSSVTLQSGGSKKDGGFVMGNRSNTRNGLFFKRLSPRGDIALYGVVILEGNEEIGTVRKESQGRWAAIDNEGTLKGYKKDRQAAGEFLRSDEPKKGTFATLFKAPVEKPKSAPVKRMVLPEQDTEPEKPALLVEEPKPETPKKTAKKAPTAKAKLKKDKPKKPRKMTTEVRRKIEWKKGGDRTGFQPTLKSVGPEPVIDHPPKVSWKGKGEISMFPSAIRAKVKKNQRFVCDEQYVNGDDELTYILVYGNGTERYFEAPAQYFRAVKR